MITTETNACRGFTLLETMIALVVLGIAAIGALAGFIAASNNVRDGQLRQFKTALAESRAQSLALVDKSLIGTTAGDSVFGSVGTWPGKSPADVAIGGAPWKLDPLGAFFRVQANGVVQPVASTDIGSPASCADAAAATGIICREVAVLPNMPDNTSGPAGSTVYTVWTRVIREGDPAPAANPSLYAVVDREVVFR